jgi:hypothetical protein
MLKHIDEASNMLNKNARDKGFWEPLSRMDRQDHIIFYLKQLQMINTEVSEITEKGDDQVVEEMADVIVRLLDLYGGLVTQGYTSESLQEHFDSKIEKNLLRPNMHGVLA